MDDFFYGMHKIHQMIVENDLPDTYSWSKVVVGGSGAQVFVSGNDGGLGVGGC